MKQFEEPEEALRREVREESGLHIEIVKPINVFHEFHGERTVANDLIVITYWCKSYSDQVVLSYEHSQYCWVSPDQALELAEHEGVRRDIQAFIAELASS